MGLSPFQPYLVYHGTSDTVSGDLDAKDITETKP